MPAVAVIATAVAAPSFIASRRVQVAEVSHWSDVSADIGSLRLDSVVSAWFPSISELTRDLSPNALRRNDRALAAIR
jgi:hypothetical protein